MHCFGHCLNLCLQDVGRQIPALRDALDIVREIRKLIKYWPERSHLFSQKGLTFCTTWRVIVAVVMIHQLDIRTCTAQKKFFRILPFCYLLQLRKYPKACKLKIQPSNKRWLRSIWHHHFTGDRGQSKHSSNVYLFAREVHIYMHT